MLQARVESSQGGRRRRHRESAARSVLEAAEPLFREQGYAGTTLEDVSRAADVSVGTLYNYFGGKRGLYLASVERALEMNREYMDEAFREGMRPVEQLVAAGDAYLRFHLEHPGYFQMVALPHVRADEANSDVAERIASTVEREVGRLADAISRAVEAGEALPVDPRTTSVFLWGAWNGVVALNARPDRLRLGDDELEAVLAAGRRLVLEGVASPSLRGGDCRLADGSLA